MTQLHLALMRRDDLEYSQADEIIQEMRRLVLEEGYDPEEVLYEEGLEPDYVFDLIDY